MKRTKGQKIGVGKINKAVGLQMFLLRNETGIYQKEMAGIIGVCENQYMKYESGENRIQLETVDSFAKHFGKRGWEILKKATESLDDLSEFPQNTSTAKSEK